MYGWKNYFWAVDKKLKIGFYQNLWIFFEKKGGTECFSSNWVKFMRGFKCCDNWKMIDWERLDLLTWMIKVLLWIGANYFMKRTCQLYNNGRFSPIWWQLSASSETNIGKWGKRRDFFSNCTSFLFFYVM